MYQFNNMYGYQPPVQMQRQFAQPRFKCVPVSSFDEARNAVIDFDGTTTIFVDMVSGRIYTKRISETGLAELKVYSQETINAPAQPLEERVAAIEAQLNEIKGGIRYAADNAIDADVTEQPKSSGTASAAKRK